MKKGRPRSRALVHVPPHVEKKNGNWVYRPYLGKINGKRTFGPRVKLCSANAPTSELFKAYDRVTNGGEHAYTVNWLMKQYQQSKYVQGLKGKADYENYMRIISGFKTKDGRTLGVQPLSAIHKTFIRRYLDEYRDGQYPVAANRHIQYLKAAWNYVEQRDKNVPPNPCEKVTLNKEESRDRYVTDVELEQYKSFCSNRSYMPLAMELAYLCRLRSIEVYAIRKEHIENAGLRVFRGKGSRGEITKWTPRLRKAVNDCLQWNAVVKNKEVVSPFLLHDKKGVAYNEENHASQWQRLHKKADAAGVERFNFHDLKAKGYTDQKVKDAGHKSAKMDAVYDRRGRVVAPADGELPLED